MYKKLYLFSSEQEKPNILSCYQFIHFLPQLLLNVLLWPCHYISLVIHKMCMQMQLWRLCHFAYPKCLLKPPTPLTHLYSPSPQQLAFKEGLKAWARFWSACRVGYITFFTQKCSSIELSKDCKANILSLMPSCSLQVVTLKCSA